MLSIQNLHVTVGEAEIIKGLSLEIPAGQVHAIMGPNGAGKSTLSYALAGRPGYAPTAGSVTLDGDDLLALAPSERAAKGVFLSFQYPTEITGVPALTFIRTALNALMWAVEHEKCERIAIMGVNKDDPMDNLQILLYPDDEREAFRQQLVDWVNTKMGDS